MAEGFARRTPTSKRCFLLVDFLLAGLHALWPLAVVEFVPCWRMYNSIARIASGASQGSFQSMTASRAGPLAFGLLNFVSFLRTRFCKRNGAQMDDPLAAERILQLVGTDDRFQESQNGSSRDDEAKLIFVEFFNFVMEGNSQGMANATIHEVAGCRFGSQTTNSAAED